MDFWKFSHFRVPHFYRFGLSLHSYAILDFVSKLPPHAFICILKPSFRKMSEDNGQYFVGDRLVSDLKVVELRKELELRSLPKSGNKKELVERLQNFLRDEKAEQTCGEQPQQAQQTAPTTEFNQSTTVPNVVAQYLAQQQIQLQAARRSADNIRIGSSVGDSSAILPSSPPAATEIQISMEEQNDDENQVQSHSESALEGANLISTVREKETPKENEREMKEVVDEGAEEQREADNSEDQTTDATDQKMEEEQEEGGPVAVVGEHKSPKEEESENKTRSAIAEEELDFENEEEEEEREEPADDGGKRRLQLHQGSPMTMQQNKVPVQAVAEEKATILEQTHDSEIGHASIKEESSKPPEGQQETTPEGFVRRRPSSPARNPPSRWIHIRNLKRPFTKAALFDLLGKFGTVDSTHFWMDSIKSTCIATYETEEQAQLARERLHNVVWPVASDLALCVEYSTEEKLKRRKAEEEREASANNSALGGGLGLTIVVDNRSHGTEPMSISGPTVLIQHDKERKKEDENRKRKVEELEKSQKTLDELFKKTKTLPSIYFLPLSDEEASKRRRKISDDKDKQAQHTEFYRNSASNSSRHRQSAGGGSSRRSGGGGEGGGRHRQSRR